MTTKKAKKKSAQQHEDGGYVAVIVPVKILIEHGDTILQEYEDDIDIHLDETTEEGKHYLAQFFYFTREQGLSTESALFTMPAKHSMNTPKKSPQESALPPITN